ncbi:WecB/TagA/CpsF family glycosyltransferase [Mucilaginibacter sp. FT3.2]|uniref:WecB/TagA/CpsF family glycosyltransferase n=1 Tax=Mucilaginibacter sp. FT3.2 TaxID=2723090 RepID=UPI00161F8174|nr:WecB/TagA/CpsF family glycosyltransferase [Mucilaginibacter sp. FT3.2]MBB6230156.1 N-acetylglucosaminyldiphosphoundecaprenol N-acetyl-beta-D-mannosaminyltransferase [Mucilaginibacter sp. FT3.2]
MGKFESVNWLSYNIFKGDLEQISFENKILVNTINQYSYCVAEKDSGFKDALINSDILLPDGIAIVMAVRRMLKLKIKKIAGADIHSHLLESCYKNNKTCFYLGSSEKTLKEIKKRLSKEYPDIKVGFYSPPYKAKFSDEDNTQMLNAINAFKPDVLFVGMTAPKQEKWAHEFKPQINAHVICTIGAVFDFYAGTVERPHKIWINLGLEWFIRLLKEPSRMWKRYIYYGPIFLLKLSRVSNKNI